MKSLVLSILVPVAAFAQLREFDVSDIQQPPSLVVQASTQFPDNAIIIVYTSIRDLNFRSSMAAISKTNYNSTAGRYEILVQPLKQVIFVGAPGFIESAISTINPNPKQALYFKVDEKLLNVLTDKSRVTIESDPIGASIVINEIETVYSTPATHEIPSGVSKITLRKQSYLDFDTIVRMKPGEQLKLSPKMVPAWADLQVTIEPREARISLNGSPYGRGTLELAGIEKGLTPGRYEITAAHENHRTFTRSVELRAGQNQKIDGRLEPIMTRLIVRTEPSGAKVKIDGQLMGITPIERDFITGAHVIDIEKDGYGSVSRTVTLQDQASNIINEVLKTGRAVTFSSDPNGAQLMLDGKLIGLTPQTLPVTFGEHRIKFINKTKTSESTLRVTPESSDLFFADVREEAKIVIRARPAGSDIFLNDELVGKGSVHAVVKLGYVNIRVIKSGYEEHIESRQVSSGGGEYSIKLNQTPELRQTKQENQKKFIRGLLGAALVVALWSASR